MAQASKKVLITAVDSFTGTHLTTHLRAKGYEVFGTTRQDCDITNRDDLAQTLSKITPDYIIHLAGISFAAHSNEAELYNLNTIAPLNILKTLLKLKIKPTKIILPSSATIYGNQNTEVLDETLYPQPTNHYGASKYAMESLARAYFTKLPIIITRPFNYTGVGQAKEFLIPKIVSHFKEHKKEIELGNLHVSREFNDIDFVCKAYEKLLQTQTSSELFNICSGRAIKLQDIIQEMNTLANYNITVKVNPAFIRKDDIKTLKGDPSKLFNEVGKIEQKSLKETLKEMLKA